MRAISAGVTLVNVATICGLLFGMAGHGLSSSSAAVSLIIGALAAICSFVYTVEAARSFATPSETSVSPAGSRQRYQFFWLWAAAGCFALFAFRSFCWLLYIDGNELKIQSPNNLGDLSLHITYINNFAHGVSLWPDNPIFVFSKLRYPAGIDLFNGLLVCSHFDLIRGLVCVGLLGCAASCWALYRWAGVFGISAFLFNGGLAGFQFFYSFHWLDYQGDKSIAWKSIPLAMLTTQRGLLYAVPAGLLLLYHWRSKYFGGVTGIGDPGRAGLDQQAQESRPHRGRLQVLPFWVELSIYATMPLFHVHTFLALSIVLAFFFLFGDSARRKDLALLVGLALLPATFLIWLITDHFQARSILEWHPGFAQNVGDFAAPFIWFWARNFGLTLPFMLMALGLSCWGAWQRRAGKKIIWTPAVTFLVPATVIFLLACLVKTAPWEWDNTKLILWAYLIFVPFIWSELFAAWPVAVRTAACIGLFASGFISLFGGLAAGNPGYTVADRAEVDAVGNAIRKLPIEARFAAYPTYNHPLLLQGRKLVLGYAGHLWTQGFDYQSTSDRLTHLMLGADGWREDARFLRVRYLFWGKEEKSFYPASRRPWEQENRLVNNGSWGAIYDLDQPAPKLGD
ncbi:MAG: hypothetical protein H0U99_07125 [Chthoniobacterales bacterium]|nr:hypothetical protein [Chthoniobacterales bacterium]